VVAADELEAYLSMDKGRMRAMGATLIAWGDSFPTVFTMTIE
jgi:hypothetical protein